MEDFLVALAFAVWGVSAGVGAFSFWRGRRWQLVTVPGRGGKAVRRRQLVPLGLPLVLCRCSAVALVGASVLHVLGFFHAWGWM